MVAPFSQPAIGLWNKLPGYESDEDGSAAGDEPSDNEEIERLVDERLADVRTALGDRWVEPRFVHFSPPDGPEPEGAAPLPQVPAMPSYRLVPTWRSFTPATRPLVLRPEGPTFRINGIDAPVLRQTLSTNGLAPTKDRDQVILWNGSRVHENTYRLLASHQKVNHFPGSTELTMKDRMFCHLEAMTKRFGKSAFDFIPETYVLPDQLDEFLDVYQRSEYIWIVKPNALSCGRGIFFLKTIDDIPLEGTTVVSRYIHKPLLIQGLKFDLRIYVLVTSFEPLRAYTYREGLVRFASKPYSCEGRHIHDVYRHLTNYSVNKNAPGFLENKEVEADNVGHKWSFSALNKHLEATGYDHQLMWTRIMDLLVKSLLSVQPVIIHRQRELNMRSPNCFEIYGFDVLVDEELKPWLLEVNLSPSMRAESPLDWRIKSSLLADSFNLVGIVSDASSQPPSPPTTTTTMYGAMPRTRSMPVLSSVTGYASTYSAQLAQLQGVEVKQGIAKEPVVLDALSESQLKAVCSGMEEFKRCQNFCRLYPTRKAVRRYAGLVERKVKGMREDPSVEGLHIGASQLLASVLFGPRPVQTRPPPPRESKDDGRPTEAPRGRAASEQRRSRASPPCEDASESWSSLLAEENEVLSAPSPSSSNRSGAVRPPDESRCAALGLLRSKFPDDLLVLGRLRQRVKSGLPPMPLPTKLAPPLTGLSFQPQGKQPLSDLGRLRPGAGGLTAAAAIAVELCRASSHERSGSAGGPAAMPQRSRRRRSEAQGEAEGKGGEGLPAAEAQPSGLEAPLAPLRHNFVFTSPALSSAMKNIEL